MSIAALAVVALIVPPALYWFYRYATGPITWKVPVSDLSSYLERLLRRGYDGSFVMIRDPGSARFVQVAKYIKSKGHIGLELSFPRTTWSAQYYPKLQAWLEEKGIPFKRQPVKTKSTDEFLDVDFGRDIALALTVVNAILTSIFQLTPSTLVRVRFSDLSLWDELIDDPDRRR